MSLMGMWTTTQIHLITSVPCVGTSELYSTRKVPQMCFLMYYSGKIEVGTTDLIKPLWPGDELVDWLFFNHFNFGGG